MWVLVAIPDICGMIRNQICPGLLEWWLFFNQIWANKAIFCNFMVKINTLLC
jgi:hypothetical protein